MLHNPNDPIGRLLLGGMSDQALLFQLEARFSSISMEYHTLTLMQKLCATVRDHLGVVGFLPRNSLSWAHVAVSNLSSSTIYEVKCTCRSAEVATVVSGTQSSFGLGGCVCV